MSLRRIYQHSLALLTDLYQLTMAYGYWKEQVAEREAVFHLTFRKNPFGGGYAIAAGLSHVVDWLDELRFTADDIEFLSGICGADEKPLFESEFLEYLTELQFSCDIDAVPEGTVVFPHEPLVRVRGPLLHSQIIETGLLTLINFQTLVATKASRVCRAVRGESVLEFGLRRAQGIDGGLSASRAAYIGGCEATSNVLAGKLFDIPVKGTHAHSWVMSFDDELESFQAYADALPNNCVFLVDTYDTISGVQHAINVGTRLRERGFDMVGIRLDSGNLADLSIRSRRMLDEAGFSNAAIVASNDLDEWEIGKLKDRGAMINVWGVGTRLVTAYDQPALGGIYKLSALRRDDGSWQHKIKLSNEPDKVSTPGNLQVRRFFNDRGFVADAIHDELSEFSDNMTVLDQVSGQASEPSAGNQHEDLLIPIFRGGKSVYSPPSAKESRSRTIQQLANLADETKRLSKPATFPVGLERTLHNRKRAMIDRAKRSRS